MPMLLTISILILALYACVFAAYVRLFIKETSRLGRFLHYLLVIALASHVGYVLLLGLTLKHPPITTPYESMTTLAMLVALIYAYIEFRTKIRSTGALIFMFVLGLQAISTGSLSVALVIPQVMGSPLLTLHIALALLGYTAFCISFLYSIMYLMLHEDIKSSHFGLMFEKLPSLEQLDDMNFRAVAAGVIIQLLAIIVSFLWAWTAFGRMPFGDIKVLASVGIAAVYGTTLYLKRRLGWGGERSAIMSVAGFFVVLVALLIVNVFGQSFHSFL